MAFQLPGFSANSITHMVKFATWSAGLTVSALNAAANRVGCVFMAKYTGNMNGFIVSHGANGGSPTGTQCDLYAVDANGFPTGASLATVTYTPTTNAVQTVAFAAAYSVTAGTCYALVFQNTTATPATNYAQLAINIQDLIQDNLLIRSTDSGSTWASLQFRGSLHICPDYATYGGWAPTLFTGSGATTGSSLYNASGSRKARDGVKVRFEHDVLLWSTIFRTSSNVGSPTFNVCSEVCSSSALLSTSDTVIPASWFTNAGLQAFRWNTPYRLLANTDYYICISPSDATAGDSSNYVRLQAVKPLVKPGSYGPIIDTYVSTASGGPSWSQLATNGIAVELHVEIPKPNQMYYAGMTGGFNG